MATHLDSSPESFADSVEDPAEEGKEAVAKAGADSLPPNRSPSAARRRTRLPPKPSTRTPPPLQRLEPELAEHFVLGLRAQAREGGGEQVPYQIRRARADAAARPRVWFITGLAQKPLLLHE